MLGARGHKLAEICCLSYGLKGLFMMAGPVKGLFFYLIFVAQQILWFTVFSPAFFCDV